MLNQLEIILKIIEEHKKIRYHVRLVGDTFSDRESLGTLKEIGHDWVPSRLDILNQKKTNLQKTLALLREGLKNHFGYEEEYLPDILGRLLMQALLLDHEKIKDEMARIDKWAAETNIDNLDRNAILTTEIQMQETVDGLSRMIETHAQQEEVVLDMVKNALENTPV